MYVYAYTMPRRHLPVNNLCIPEVRYCFCFPCTVLLQHGADPNIRNTDGKSALDLADPSAKAVLTGKKSRATKLFHLRNYRLYLRKSLCTEFHLFLLIKLNKYICHYLTSLLIWYINCLINFYALISISSKIVYSTENFWESQH